MEIRKPNVFVVGVPRSGKVQVRNALSKHPEIYVNMVDTDFFSEDVEGKQDRINSIQKYLSYFKNAKDKKIILDQVSRSAVSRVAAQKIKEFNPDSKIIIHLRNPAEQMFSWHNACIRLGYETEPDFLKAIQLEKKRKEKGRPGIIKNYYYRDMADYYPQVKRYIDAFGKDNVHVLLLDELRADEEGTYYKLLKFLGVKKHKPDFTTKNEARMEPKNKFFVHFNNFFITLPKPLRLAVKKIFPSKLVTKVKAFTLKELKEKQKIDSQIQYKINKSFEPNLKKLEKLIGKDLSKWYAPKPQSTIKSKG